MSSRRLIIAAMMIAFAGSAPVGPFATPAIASQRERSTKQFEALWNERLNSYRSAATASAARHKAAADALTSKAFTFTAGDSRFDELIGAAENDSRNSGKGSELSGFLAHIKSRPSPAVSQAYLQGRVQQVGDKASEADRARDVLAAALKSTQTTYAKLYVDAEQAAMTRGEAIGRTQELQLIIENFDSYSADFAAAGQRDSDNRSRWMAALAGMGRSLSVPPPPMRPVTSVNCTTMGNMTSCTGQ
jgi:hypothetical protein